MGHGLVCPLQSEAVRASEEVRACIDPLTACGGAAARWAQKLQVVLAGTQQAHAEGGDEEMLTIEDMQAGPGGRHDNDHADYRCAVGPRLLSGPTCVVASVPRGKHHALALVQAQRSATHAD